MPYCIQRFAHDISLKFNAVIKKIEGFTILFTGQ